MREYLTNVHGGFTFVVACTYTIVCTYTNVRVTVVAPSRRVVALVRRSARIVVALAVAFMKNERVGIFRWDVALGSNFRKFCAVQCAVFVCSVVIIINSVGTVISLFVTVETKE